MGRAHEVRAKSMAATSAARSALFLRASKEIYMAAKAGEPDPQNNLALRSAIEKYRKQCPKDVIDRAIKKAAGGEQETYIAGRYEFYGPGNSYIIVDTLTDNVNRAVGEVRSAVTKKGGKMGTVAYNFEELGILVFKGDNRDEVEEDINFKAFFNAIKRHTRDNVNDYLYYEMQEKLMHRIYEYRKRNPQL